MIHKENKSFYVRFYIYFPSNFKSRAFKSYTRIKHQKADRHRDIYRLIYKCGARTIRYYLRGDRGIREKNNAEGSEPPMGEKGI